MGPKKHIFICANSKISQIIHPSPTHTTTTVRTIITDTDISSPACAIPKIRAYDNMVHREKIGLK